MAGVGLHAPQAERHPREQQREEHRPSHPLLRAERGALVAATVTIAAGAGVGWLYMLFQAGALAAGPRLGGALPLEQLASSDAQPLLRLAAAWLPAGLAAGTLVGGLTGLGRAARAGVVGLLSGLVLVAAGAVSDAIALNERVVPHLGSQLGRPGTWAAVALMLIGSLPARRGRTGRSPSPAASVP